MNDADHRNAVILTDGWATALRAGDGPHLVIAVNNGASVYTFDHGVAASRAVPGVPVMLLAQATGSSL